MKDTEIEKMLEYFRNQVRDEVETDFFARLGQSLGLQLDRDKAEDAIELLKALMPRSPKRFVHSHKSNKQLEAMIDDLKPRPDRTYMRALGDGLQVRVYPSGKKTFAYRYMLNGRRPSPLDLGPYVPARKRTPENLGVGLTVEEAAEKVIELRCKLLDKKDPIRYVHRKGISVKDLYKQYLDEYFKPKSAAKELTTEQLRNIKVVSDKYHRRICLRFEKFILPDFGGRPVITIDPFEIQALLDAVESSNGRATADEIRKAFSGLIDWATTRKKHKSFHLLDGIKQVKGESRKRFILKTSDLKEFHEYLNDDRCPIPVVQRRILMAMLLIGSRNQETSEAMWNEFDLENRLWIVPARRMKGKEPGSGIMKSNGFEAGVKQPHAVFVTDLLLELLGTRKGAAVFAKHYKKQAIDPNLPSSPECPQSGLNMAKKHAAFSLPFPELNAYDLRHTFSSHMDSLGFSPLDYGRCMSHSDFSTKGSENEAIKQGYRMTAKQTYAQVNLFKAMRKKAEVWIAWEAEVCKLLGRPVPAYPEELLKFYEELGRPGGDEEYFKQRPELLTVITSRY